MDLAVCDSSTAQFSCTFNDFHRESVAKALIDAYLASDLTDLHERRYKIYDFVISREIDPFLQTVGTKLHFCFT